MKMDKIQIPLLIHFILKIELILGARPRAPTASMPVYRHLNIFQLLTGGHAGPPLQFPFFTPNCFYSAFRIPNSAFRIR